MMTPELKAYAAQIIIQRGIEVLTLALKKMDEAACKFLDSRAVQNQIAKAVYDDIRASA